MSATRSTWSRVEVQPGGTANTLRVHFTLDDGAHDTIGWQLYDPASGNFISEGEWRQIGSGSAGMTLDLSLPAEEGDYDVYISPRDPERGWAFARGEPFLLVRARSLGAGVSAAAEVVTIRELRMRRLRIALRSVLTRPFELLREHWPLIRTMVGRDLAVRYRGSFGGALWTVLHPLLLMATYFFVFGVVLQARFGADESRTGFALYFLAGMLPWLAFSEAVGRAPYTVIEHRHFVKKLVFPVEILPANLAVAGLATGGIAAAVFLVALLVVRGSISPTALWLPLLVIPQLLFTTGLCWFLAGLGAYVRDLGQVIGLILTLWFFLTPICYPESALPESARVLLTVNPIYVLVRGYRAVLLESAAPPAQPLLVFTGLSLVLFIAGQAWFQKLRRGFADVM